MNIPFKTLNESAVKELENFDGLIWAAKGDILLTVAGYRPSTFIYLETPVYSTKDTPLSVDSRSIDRLVKILRAFDLKYEKRDRIIDESDGKFTAVTLVDFFVARTPQSAHTLHKAINDQDHTAIGNALGYPETAVLSFLTPNMLDIKDHPVSTDTVSGVNMLLLGHRLSKDNWREEVEYLEPSGNFIKSISPSIYSQLTRR